MTGVLFSDIVSTSVDKLAGLLEGRNEACATNVEVSNSYIEGATRMVTVAYAGGPGDTDTLDTVYLAVNTFDPDEGTATDLTLLVRALFTGRGPGSMRDGKPITYTSVNVGPTPIFDRTGVFQFRTLYEVQYRGTNL